jgi:PAS domain S-box-containing protein
MTVPIKVLMLEDREEDAVLVLHELRRAGFAPEARRVEDQQSFIAALDDSFDLILADYRLPGWSGLAALEACKARGLDVPFILVSGTIGEEEAVEAIRRGADDYLLKDRLARLGRAVQQQLERRRLRAERFAEEQAHEAARQRAEATVRDSELRHRLLFESSPLPMWVYEIETLKILAVNPAAIRHYGFSEAEFLALTIRDIRPAEDIAVLERELPAIRAGAERTVGNYRHMKKSGDVIDVEITAEPIVFDGRRARLILAVDVTERKQAESALRDAASLLRIAGRTARLGGWKTEGTRMLLSDEVCAILEVAAGSSLTPEVFAGFCAPASRSALLSAFQRCMQQGEGFDLELEIESATGRRIWARCIGEADRRTDGGIERSQGSLQDITERRAADEALRQSEKKYRDIIDFAPVGFYQTTLDGRFGMVNRKFAEMFGYDTPEQMQGVDITTDIYSTPEDRPRFLSSIEKQTLIEGAEFCLRKKDGSLVWVEINSRALLGEDGNLHGVEGFVTNIDARKRMEQELLDSERRYRAVIDGAEEVIYTLSPEGLLTSINPAFERLTGWRTEEWVGRSFWPLIYDADRGGARKTWEGLIAGNSMIADDIRLNTRDGGVVVLQITSAPAFVDGRLLQISGVGRDVTAQRKVERERRELTRRLELVLESTDEGLYVVDRQGICTMVNRSASRLLGWEPAEMVGRDVHSLIHHTRSGGEAYPKHDCGMYRCMESGRSLRDSNELFWTKSGNSLPVDTASSPIFDGGAVSGAVVTFTDVTTRRAMERQLENANRVASLGRLAATIAHEFNNVLMGIQPFAEVISRNAGENARLVQASQHIGNSVKRGRRITQEILRFTQPTEPDLRPIRMHERLSELEPELRSLLPKSITLTIRPAAKEDVHVLGDPAQLQQIIVNLVLNARDAMPNGGALTISATLDADDAAYPFGVVSEPSRFLHLAVADTGVGMPREMMNHIFDPLFTTKPSGTGLGLAVTHHVVKSHGGEIFVESHEGAGSIFHLFLPLASPGEALSGEASESQRRPAPGHRVLLVEDDEAVAKGLVAILEMEGFEVDAVAEGKLALGAVQTFSPDAVILDVGLPDMSGIDVYHEIARSRPDLPVLFSTGEGDVRKIEALTGGNVDYLVKPYEIDTLLDRLSRLECQVR